MKTFALNSLIKISQEIQISKPMPLTPEEAERVYKAREKALQEENARLEEQAWRRRMKAERGRDYSIWEYDPNNPPLVDTIMTNLVDGVSKAVSTGAKKAWNATAGFRNRFGNWFNSTLDKPDALQPGQPRFLGR